MARLDDRDQCPHALDGLAELLDVGRRPLAGRRGEAGLADCEVQEGDERLQEDVVNRDALHLGFQGADLILGELWFAAHAASSSGRIRAGSAEP